MKPVYALFLAALSGCATVITPSRCETALSAAQTASEIIAVLQARGVAPGVADKLAQAIVIGQVTLAAACASASP